MLIKIIKGLFVIAVLIILPVVVATLIFSKTDRLGIQSFVVLSGSMQPTFDAGSVIYTQRQSWYPKGAVIAFKTGDVIVTHRIVNVVNHGNVLYYTTKGDANNTRDSKTITNNKILGKEFFSMPYLGRAIVFLREPLGFFGVVFFPLVVFLILEFWNLKREIEKEIEKKLQKKMELAIND